MIVSKPMFKKQGNVTRGDSDYPREEHLGLPTLITDHSVKHALSRSAFLVLEQIPNLLFSHSIQEKMHPYGVT